MFWDSSALVPLVIDEASTKALKAIASLDDDLVVSFITPLEVESAVWRRVRSDKNEIARAAALQRLRELARRWTVVGDVETTFPEAYRVIEKYQLRSADAIQLATALILAEPKELTIITNDEELTAAAQSEGFPTLP